MGFYLKALSNLAKASCKISILLKIIEVMQSEGLLKYFLFMNVLYLSDNNSTSYESFLMNEN
jgi:hypothetical protein